MTELVWKVYAKCRNDGKLEVIVQLLEIVSSICDTRFLSTFLTDSITHLQNFLDSSITFDL